MFAGITTGENEVEQGMLEQKFLDRFDMGRRIQSRLYCFGSGSSDSDSGGSDDSGSVGGSGDSAFYDNERPGLTNQNRPVGGTTNVVQGKSQPRDDGGSGATEALTNIVTMGLPAPTIGNAPVSATEEIAMNRLIDQMDMEQRMIPPVFQPEPQVLSDFQRDLANELAVSNARLGNNVPIQIVDGAAARQGIIGIEDEYDPFTGTGRTAMDVLNYDTDDQSGPAGQIRPFGGLTRAQQANLEGRNDFVARNILAAQTPQPSGIPTTNLTGIYTVGDDPMGDVRGFTDFGPTLPFLGPTQVYTGFGGSPFAPPDTSSDETVPPVTNPLTGRDQCPDGYVFDEDLQACRRKTKRELQADNGTGGGSSEPAGDMFFRRTSLDDAPANLPSGFDFDAANRAFTQSFAVRPSFFQRPPDLTGYTLL